MDDATTHGTHDDATEADLNAFLGDTAGCATDLPAWLLPSYLREDAWQPSGVVEPEPLAA